MPTHPPNEKGNADTAVARCGYGTGGGCPGCDVCSAAAGGGGGGAHNAGAARCGCDECREFRADSRGAVYGLKDGAVIPLRRQNTTEGHESDAYFNAHRIFSKSEAQGATRPIRISINNPRVRAMNILAMILVPDDDAACAAVVFNDARLHIAINCLSGYAAQDRMEIPKEPSYPPKPEKPTAEELKNEAKKAAYELNCRRHEKKCEKKIAIHQKRLELAIAHNTAIDEKLAEYKQRKIVVTQKILQRLRALQVYFIRHDPNPEDVVTALNENGGIHKKRVGENHRRYKVPYDLTESEMCEHVIRHRIQKLKRYISNDGKNTNGEGIFTGDEICALKGNSEAHVHIPPPPQARKTEKSVIHAEQYLLYQLFNRGQTPLPKDEVIGTSRPLCGVCHTLFTETNQKLMLMDQNNGQFLVGSSHQARNAYTSVPQHIEEKVSKDPTPFGEAEQLHSESGESDDSGYEADDNGPDDEDDYEDDGHEAIDENSHRDGEGVDEGPVDEDDLDDNGYEADNEDNEDFEPCTKRRRC